MNECTLEFYLPSTLIVRPGLHMGVRDSNSDLLVYEASTFSDLSIENLKFHLNFHFGNNEFKYSAKITCF